MCKRLRFQTLRLPFTIVIISWFKLVMQSIRYSDRIFQNIQNCCNSWTHMQSFLFQLIYLNWTWSVSKKNNEKEWFFLHLSSTWRPNFKWLFAPSDLVRYSAVAYHRVWEEFPNRFRMGNRANSIHPRRSLRGRGVCSRTRWSRLGTACCSWDPSSQVCRRISPFVCHTPYSSRSRIVSRIYHRIVHVCIETHISDL